MVLQVIPPRAHGIKEKAFPDLLPAVSPGKSLSQRLENEETTFQFYQVIVHTGSISELLLAPRDIQNL